MGEMVKGCGVVLLFFCVHHSYSSASPTSPALKTVNDHDDDTENTKDLAHDDEFYQDHWLQKLLEYTRRDLRSESKDNMFWATRGKRSPDIEDFWAIRGKKPIKPNGLFQAMSAPGKRGLKPNGLFSSIKRASIKPNSLFNAYKRSSMKPNGLFGTFKRPSLKPNGLFGAFKRAFEYENYLDEDYMDDDFDIDLINELMEEEYEEDDHDMEKRADFWAARGKKDDAHFWATRG